MIVLDVHSVKYNMDREIIIQIIITFLGGGIGGLISFKIAKWIDDRR